MPRTSASRLVGMLFVGVLATTVTGCGSDTPTDELVSKLELSVQADEKAAPRTGSLSCPGTKAKDRDICAALDVVAPKVFEPVPVDQACTAIYGGPRKATITGTYQEEPVSAVFTQENGCEIARWNQIKPVLKGLGLTS
ncbi:hypothetical protein [Aeromicrobium sp.]|uniref:hypothetical protein n=1 Tax=Aeromicrobium sp. TaxID=1871063 RepID=UPI003C593104